MTDQPIACSLTPDQVPARRAALVELVEHGLLEARLDGPVGRLRFRDDASTEQRLAEFVRLEQACCPFFSFATTRSADGIRLEVRAPDGAEAMVAGLVDAFRVPETAQLPPLPAR